MVNRGASKGCLTCKQRRVKCDEQKPKCSQCLRLGRECGGYGKKPTTTRFKDETVRYLGTGTGTGTAPDKGKRAKPVGRSVSKDPASPAATIASDITSTASSPRTEDITTFTTAATTTTATTATMLGPVPHHEYTYAIAPSPTLRQENLAVPLFLTYITDVGRSLESTRGFLEFVRPVLATERQDSALVAAINATAAKVWMVLTCQNDRSSISAASKLLNRALVRLQRAIDNPEEKTRDATVLASLILQFHENVSAVFDKEKVRGTHRDGALALLLHRQGRDQESSKYHANLLANVLHSKVSFCIRERKPLPLSEIAWLDTQVIPGMVINSTSLLDVIGISVANIQHEFWELVRTADMRKETLDNLSLKIKSAESQLQAWPETVPPHWYPIKLHSAVNFSSSVPTFEGASDVYPSLQIADVWNAWRIYRLVLIQIKGELSYRFDLVLSQDQANHIIASSANDCVYTYEAREFIDAICFSVPFYLGNCAQPPTLHDLHSLEVVFPSCHDLSPTSLPFLTYNVSADYASKEDHYRHNLLQGALHMMSVLSLLFALFEKQVLASVQVMCQEQQEWLSEQFLRSTNLLNRAPDIPWQKARSPKAPLIHQRGAVKVSEAQNMAGAVKQGLWTMNIL